MVSDDNIESALLERFRGVRAVLLPLVCAAPGLSPNPSTRAGVITTRGRALAPRLVAGSGVAGEDSGGGTEELVGPAPLPLPAFRGESPRVTLKLVEEESECDESESSLRASSPYVSSRESDGDRECIGDARAELMLRSGGCDSLEPSSWLGESPARSRRRRLSSASA